MASPARRQYLDIKAQHEDALLAYNIGDFYEFFDEDARIVAGELQIVLTARSYGPGEAVPLAGVPIHALETYLARLQSGCLRSGEPTGQRAGQARGDAHPDAWDGGRAEHGTHPAR